MKVEAKTSQARVQLGFLWNVRNLVFRNDVFIPIWKGLTKYEFIECGGLHKIMQKYHLPQRCNRILNSLQI